MKAGGVLLVMSVNPVGRPVLFPISLVGFGASYDGKPFDNAKYTAARKQMMEQIRAGIRARLAKRAAQGAPEPKKN